jgi:putative ABC transport system permease protein
MSEGRFLSQEDVELGRNVVVLGFDVKDQLFPFGTSVGKTVTINNQVYEVIGAFEKVGTTGLSGTDRNVIAPLSALRSQYSNMGSMTVNVFVEDPRKMDYAMEEATGIFRLVRGLPIREKEDFAISKSDSFVNQFLDQLWVITLSAQVIAFITLLGASVALLNVMLVSVTERTNEIGLRKALGAAKRNILLQFLFEAIVICQAGGLLGVVMGIFGGNLVSRLAFDGAFVIPWVWVIIGLVSCFAVGIGAGYLPARKAAMVDPIVALQRV